MTKADLVVQDLLQQLNAALVISANRSADLALLEQEARALREAVAAAAEREAALKKELEALRAPAAGE